jgi:hypothetical protein
LASQSLRKAYSAIGGNLLIALDSPGSQTFAAEHYDVREHQ